MNKPKNVNPLPWRENAEHDIVDATGTPVFEIHPMADFANTAFLLEKVNDTGPEEMVKKLARGMTKLMRAIEYEEGEEEEIEAGLQVLREAWEAYYGWRTKVIMLDAYAQPDGGRVNGVDDPSEPTVENSAKMPFLEKCGKEWRWRPIIQIETGRILEWPKGTVASVYYKPCDDCKIQVNGRDLNYGEYVPDFLSPKDACSGDYIIMEIDGDGNIERWQPKDCKKWLARKMWERKK